MDGSPARFVITLVHGTFARGAPWTQEGSALWRALKERFGAAARIQRFDWSARNTHSARLRAGRELAKFLDRSAADNPGARNVVITHSHGGNVAIYACRHAAPQSINDIVFLATPFIRCRDRARISLLTYAGLFLLSGLLGLIFLNLVLPLSELLAYAHRFLPATPAVDRLVSWGVLVTVTGLIFLAFLGYLRRSARKRVESLAWPAASDVDTLCVYYRGDEAKRYLGALNWSTTRISRLIWQLIGLAIILEVVYAGTTEYVKAYHPDLYQSVYFSTPSMWWGEGPEIKRGSWYQYVGLYLLAFLPPAALLAYALPLMRGHPLGYGWERPSATMLVDVDVISEPVGFPGRSSESFAVDFGEAKRQGLVHSFVYEDQRILAKIVEWVGRRH